MPHKILCVAGARPNFMKIAPIVRALSAFPRLACRLVHTGQHYDQQLSKVFFEDLALPKPDFELEVGSASHAIQTGEIMKRFESIVESEQPHGVLVVGDVNSTIACALVAAKFELREGFATATGARRRPLVFHVEAGLRSFDDEMPEEVNRRLTDAISDVLFVSEPAGLENLRREGVAGHKVHFVGNVMIDSLLSARERAGRSAILESIGVTAGKYGLVTLHRPSNVDHPGQFAQLLEALDEIARSVPLVFPLHPRTRSRMAANGVRLDPARWTLIDPAGYLDFLKLMSGASIVFTDSGGVQEETTVLGVPCITLRDNTERPVTLTEGTNTLAGTTREGIVNAFRARWGAPVSAKRPKFWDGESAGRIGRAIDAQFPA